jgi:hypothetical protein
VYWVLVCVRLPERGVPLDGRSPRHGTTLAERTALVSSLAGTGRITRR